MVESSQSWIASKIKELHASNPDLTVAIVLTKAEVKTEPSFLGQLGASRDFRLDLNMAGAYWFYHGETLRRCLLVQLTKPEDRNELRSAGAKTAVELQGKKADSVHVILSDALDRENLGIFANSFYLTNYEFTAKTDPKTRCTKATDASKDEDYDPRKEKFTKKITNVVISTKDSANILEDAKYAFWVAAARASEYCRDIANTRASVATPDYMEQQVRKLVEGRPNVKDIRVVKGQ